MARQLSLLQTPPSWRLDDSTREVGRRGVAEARASLQAGLRNASAGERATASEHRSPGRSAA